MFVKLTLKILKINSIIYLVKIQFWNSKNFDYNYFLF